MSPTEIILVIVIVLLLLAFVLSRYRVITPHTVTTYYLALTGDDSAAGTETAPWKTPSTAYSRLRSGDTLIFRGGVYDTFINGSLIAAGSATGYTSLSAYPGEQVSIQPSAGKWENVAYFGGTACYLEVDRLHLDASRLTESNCVKIDGGYPGHDAHHIRIKNGRLIGYLTGAPDAKVQGILVTNAHGTAKGHNEFLNLELANLGFNDFSHPFYLGAPHDVVEGCRITQCSGMGIHLYNGGDPSHVPPIYPTFGGVKVRYNHITGGKLTGNKARHCGIIVANGADDAEIVGNVIDGIPTEGAGAQGLLIFSGNRHKVFQNTITRVAGEGLQIGAAADTVVQNNISSANTGGNYIDGGTRTVQDHNLIAADPGFVDPATGDVRITANSPAYHAGTPVGIVADCVGVPYHNPPSLGAYEVTSGPTPVPPDPNPTPPARWRIHGTVDLTAEPTA